MRFRTGPPRARPRRALAQRLLPALLLALAACTPSPPDRPDLHGAPPPAEARVVSFRGWRGCHRLRNGIVRATVVPQIGGRTVEFALGDYNFLLIGRRELGLTLATAGERRHLHFGGHSARLHPESRWQAVRRRRPARLCTGEYSAKAEADAARALLTLTSPVDLATGTRLVRRIELFGASAHLRITDTVFNVRLVAQEWGLHDFVQLKGHGTPSGVLSGAEPLPRGLALYVPLNPDSAYPGGLRFVERGPDAAAGQWNSARLPGILALRYLRQLSKVRVDPVLPWVAFEDRTTGHVFVQVCRVPEKAILTSGGVAIPYPAVEIQNYGPVARIEPGKSVGLVQDWYAARCPGPIVDVTDAGAVAKPLSLLRGDDGRTWVAGTFGPFHVGTAAVVLRDAEGAELHRLHCGKVDPLGPLELNRRIEMHPRVAEVALEVHDAQGALRGHLGKIILRPRQASRGTRPEARGPGGVRGEGADTRAGVSPSGPSR